MSEENIQNVEEALVELARDVLVDLYHALSGCTPKAVRVYGEGDALLLLLRFDPTELWGSDELPYEPLIDATFMAFPGMIASAVARRLGHALHPGNLSVSAERGLAVFAFSGLERGRELFASLTPSLASVDTSFAQ
ncbi:MAG TPA: hypothetical protein VHM72_11850 [Solirubrobacteraceae bacterium]|jgi:hypothetical protein|nr:hypothetical protein [Solirubrobacteraceae bacterium]